MARAAGSRSRRGSDGGREAPCRAGLRGAAPAAATARRRTPRAGLLPEVSGAGLSALSAALAVLFACGGILGAGGGADGAGCLTPGKEARAPVSAASQRPLISVLASCIECNKHLGAHGVFIRSRPIRILLLVLKRTHACLNSTYIHCHVC